MKTYVTVRYPQTVTLHRAASYVQLVRPRMGMLVIATAAAGWFVAGGAGDVSSLATALVATALMFGGASALNQWIERESDALMPRTASRPIPAGALLPWEALTLGIALSAAGIAYPLSAGQPVSAALGTFALITYVLVYTPLKRGTPLNTLIGAVPGAVPPLIGWATARGGLDSGAMGLFLILFLWQIPHFLAIAWIYRDEYARADLRMFPRYDPDGVRTGRQMVLYTLALIPTGLFPLVTNSCGWAAALGALMLGLLFLYSAIAFAGAPTTPHARQVFRMSLVYLSGLFLLFAFDAMVSRGM